MKRKMPFIAALSILCWGCSSYDYSGDDIVGVKAAISGTITEVVEKSRTVGTTWTDGDRIGVTCEDDVNISYKYTGNLSSFAAFDENQSIYFREKSLWHLQNIKNERALHKIQKVGNDMATVLISAFCSALHSNNSSAAKVMRICE